jgi:glycosyltransferase involved in cell wall biosynthesis
VWRLRQALERQQPYDVLMVHYKKEQLMAASLPRRLRAQLVWAEWGPVPYPFRRGLPRQAYLQAGRRADVVMAVSPGTKASVEAVGVPANKVTVVPNVVDVEAIRFTEDGRGTVRRWLGIPADAFVVGCISRFHPKKRNDVVVDGVVALDDPRVHLILAGAGETEPALRAQTGPLGDRAHFVPTPTSDVADVLSAFDVSVFCPSPTEGAPRATILGMLAERPCLATGPEGVADLIRPEFGAITSPENDPAALTALLRGYLADPSLGARQGRAARAWAEQEYARPVVAGKIERLLAAG